MVVIASAFIGGPQAAFLFTELDPTSPDSLLIDKANVLSGAGATSGTNNVLADGYFVFQYWPTQIVDNYDTEWSAKIIPGGSRPLYQYIAGGARSIAFDARFTKEVTDSGIFGSGLESSIDLLLPSSRYTVDVKAAVAALRGLQHPSYGPSGTRGSAIAPPRLRLCFPGLNIGGNSDGILCFLKSARVTYEACFPDGTPRVAIVALEFLEVVQNVAADPTASNINFISQDSFVGSAGNYKYTSTF